VLAGLVDLFEPALLAKGADSSLDRRLGERRLGAEDIAGDPDEIAGVVGLLGGSSLIHCEAEVGHSASLINSVANG